MHPLLLQRHVAVAAAYGLAQVDYTVANQVSEHVASTVEWAYLHDIPWLAVLAVQTLKSLDEVGGQLIGLVLFLVAHVH